MRGPAESLILLLAISALAQMPCRAHMGDTMDQCVVRYGKPISKPDTDPTGVGDIYIQFSKDGYTITASFLNGTVQAEIYWKTHEEDLSDDEIQAILNLESDGNAWTRLPSRNANRLWLRDNGIGAVYDHEKHAVSFFSKDYRDGMEKRKGEGEASP